LLTPGSALLLTNELSRAKISIMALQEVRRSDTGETTVAGYDTHFCGMAPRWANFEEQVWHWLLTAMPIGRALCTWQPINDRILVANFKHSFGKLSIVAA